MSPNGAIAQFGAGDMPADWREITEAEAAHLEPHPFAERNAELDRLRADELANRQRRSRGSRRRR